MSKNNVLVIGQDASLCNAIAAQMEGLEVTVTMPEQALALLSGQAFDLVILDERLDLTLPAALPVIQLSSKPLDIEASILIQKPFKRRALLTAVNRLLNNKRAELALGELALMASEKQLKAKDGQTLDLTEKEAALLFRMGREQGQVISRETLLADVWGYAGDLDTHTLETHIYRLRAKLEGWEPAKKLRIETSEGGYRLIY